MSREAILDQSFWAQKLSEAVAKTDPVPLWGCPFFPEAVLTRIQKRLQSFIWHMDPWAGGLLTKEALKSVFSKGLVIHLDLSVKG